MEFLNQHERVRFVFQSTEGYMAKEGNASARFDAIGEDLAKMLDIKRRLIESGIRGGNPEYARRILDDIRNFVRSVREELETQLRDRSLEDMTPNEAQQAIYGCQIFEESLRSDYPEFPHLQCTGRPLAGDAALPRNQPPPFGSCQEIRPPKERLPGRHA
jgi:hypothetical protein